MQLPFVVRRAAAAAGAVRGKNSVPLPFAAAAAAGGCQARGAAALRAASFAAAQSSVTAAAAAVSSTATRRWRWLEDDRSGGWTASNRMMTTTMMAVMVLPQSAPRCPLRRRSFATLPDAELNQRLAAFQDLFVEARLCIEDVVDAAETTYFDDDVATARGAVDAAVAAFDAILSDMHGDEAQRNRVLRGNGLKVEQLKGELAMAIQGGHA